jgi:hypothetical protein
VANKYALEILNCPPDPSKIKAIMYTTPTKLAVVEGASEIVSIDLQDFFVTIDNQQKASFTLPAKGEAYIPAELFTYDFNGMGAAKFVAFFPDYGTGATGSEEYIEWDYESDTKGPLAIYGTYDVTTAGWNPRSTNGMASIPGSVIGYTAAVAKVIATDGGLKFWSPEDGTKLICEFNSALHGCKRSCVHVDISNNIWTGSFYHGLTKVLWDGTAFSFELYDTGNSGIASNAINDIKTFGTKVALATDNGISILDTETKTWKNYGRYNVNQITTNIFNSIYIDNEHIIGGADLGVFVYTISNNTWRVYNSLTLPGWTGTNDVKTLEIVEGTEIFAGTDSTILTFPIGATLATEIPNTGFLRTVTNQYQIGASGSTASFYNQGMTGFTIANNAIVNNSLQNVTLGGVTVGFTATYISGTFPNTSINVELAYSGTQGSTLSFSYSNAKIHTVSAIHYTMGPSAQDKINVGYLEGGISRYDVASDTWDFNYDGLVGSTGMTGLEINYGVDYLTRDNYWGNSFGYNLFHPEDLSYTILPGVNENADILTAVPPNLSYNIGLTQSVFLAFSKPVASSVLETHFTWGTAPFGALMDYEVTSFNGGQLLKVSLPFSIFGTGPTFSRSTAYTYKIGESLTATDGTYFRQTVESTFYTGEVKPATGWNILGKQLVLSGTAENPVQPIVFRNPHDFPVTITLLAGL